jgi:hypothetical protein
MKTIVNCETGEVIERELTKAEKDQQKADEAALAKIQADAAEAKAKAEADKAALLARLGLTEDELKTILG